MTWQMTSKSLLPTAEPGSACATTPASPTTKRCSTTRSSGSCCTDGNRGPSSGPTPSPTPSTAGREPPPCWCAPRSPRPARSSCRSSSSAPSSRTGCGATPSSPKGSCGTESAIRGTGRSAPARCRPPRRIVGPMHAIDPLRAPAPPPRAARRALAAGPSPAILAAHPGGHPYSAACLPWHPAREMDAQLAALRGVEQVWTAQGFDARFGLGEVGDQVGYGHTADQARSITVDDPELLIEHLEAVTDALTAYLETLTDDDLDDVIDEQWDPPVTRGVRLISVQIG